MILYDRFINITHLKLNKMKERVTLTLDKELIKEVDTRIDGYNIKNRSHAIELLLRNSLGNIGIKKAIILAGGNKNNIRPLLKVHNKPLLLHNIELLRKYKIKDIIVAINEGGSKIKETFKKENNNVNISYIEEKKPLGTAGPLKLASLYLKETFIVCNADELKNIDIDDIYRFHKKNNALITIALTTSKETKEYGVVRMKGNKIIEFFEKPKKHVSNLINAGLYIMEPSVIDKIPDGFAMMEKDLFPQVAKEERLYGYTFDGQWFNIRTEKDIETASKEWKDIE